MVDNRPWLSWLTHGVLILGVIILAFPIYVAFVASTHELDVLLRSPMPLVPGGSLVKNYTHALTQGAKAVGAMNFHSLDVNEEVAKVSIVGIGMRSHAGVAHKMFAALAEESVNIRVITTSEIKVSVLIDRKYLELAVQALHDAFELEAAG